jgi:hypothetical protein
VAAKKAAAAAAEASAEQVTGRERARGGDLIIHMHTCIHIQRHVCTPYTCMYM